MLNRFVGFTFLFSFLVIFSGCGVIETIFKAGAWTAIIGILLVLAVIVLIVRAVKK